MLDSNECLTTISSVCVPPIPLLAKHYTVRRKTGACRQITVKLQTKFNAKLSAVLHFVLRVEVETLTH
jgi:hypothetical protein